MNSSPPDSSAIEARRKEHERITAEVERRLVANAENFDKAILSYSSAGLAVSLTFLKDFVPISGAARPWLLLGSWVFFLVAILVTLLSYLTSQGAQRRQLGISAKYNLEMKDEALEEINWLQKVTEWGSYAAALSFLIAVVGSTLFVALNLEKGPNVTNTTRGTGQDGAPTAIIQRIQRTGFDRGAPAPIIQTNPQPTTTSPAPAPAPAPASGANQSGGGSGG